jgi:hypothetical protein
VPRARRISRFLAAAIGVAAAVSLCLAAAGCGSSEQGGHPDQKRTLELAQSRFSAAAQALLAGDRAAFDASLSVDEGSAAGVRESLDEVFDTLSSLPWRTFSFAVTPADPAKGMFRVEGSGQLGATGPPDRLAVVRYLKLAGADGAAVLADETPQNVRRRYLMALHDPVALQRPGLIVLADRRARERAGEVLAAAIRGRQRLADLGVGTRETVLVTVYGSAEDVRDALGTDAATVRLRFFSHPSLRAADEDWSIYDVAVMGPWLRDIGSALDDTVTHELAHAYTVRWFDGIKDPSSILVEGIAEAAEGAPASQPLRDEVASGNQLWPLPESFSVADVWDGAEMEDVGLGYDLGASLVGYVVSRWGTGKLRQFVRAVAAAEPTEAGMDEALDGSLGVTWRRFYTGWRHYVLGGS